MMLELEAIFANDLTTAVFVYGSMACLIISGIAAQLLTHQPRPVQSAIAIPQSA